MKNNMASSLIADKVWVVRQVGGDPYGNLCSDEFVATLHRIIDFGYFGEPIWDRHQIEKCPISSSMELEKFKQLSVHPVTIIY